MVNDGSKDRSVEIIEKFPVRRIDKRYRKARNPYAETVNLGIKHAKGNYIAIIDADIEVESEWLQKLLPHFRSKDLATVSGFIVASSANSWVSRLYHIMHRRTLMRAEDRRQTINEEIFPKSGFYIFRRSVFENAGLFDESIFATDIMLDLEILSRGYRQLCDMSAIAYDIRGYTTRKLIYTGVREGIAMYQTGGSMAFLHQQLLFRYIILAPHYIITLFRHGRSLVSLLFPIQALMKYFSTVHGYISATLRKEQKCPDYLRKKRREHEIGWMLNSFKREIKNIFVENRR